jgi:superfamily I DNA/RNA helicase
MACQTEDDLLAAPVPSWIVDRVVDAVYEPDLDRVLAEPEFLTGDVSDLLRFVQGELLGFLLKLDPEQERYVEWAVRGAGPTLLKGSPGTGKSTVALYRARALLRTLRADGVARPRLLLTTYTNALVAFSRQLLDRLLGTDSMLVEVCTADHLMMRIVQAADGPQRIADAAQSRDLLTRAIATAAFGGNALERRAQAQTVERMAPEYLLDEIESVIVGRELRTIDEYRAARRAGRAVPLNATQRTAVWRVYERLAALLDRSGRTTWSRLRRRAAELVRDGRGPEPYDGVIVDEVQDLEPTALRALVALCRTPDRLFITADANQSIYGSGFRWAEVHDDLQFRGRTGVLRKNYRSTREIGEAARSYLRNGALESADEPQYVETGPPPAVRAVERSYDEIRLLARYLRGATRELRLGIGACAVLVPTRESGHAVAAALCDNGVQARFMPGDKLELEAPVVKVITLKSAKGLEFPIVAIAGLLDNATPGVARGLAAEERDEAVLRERRTFFVAMTRAMRALLLVTPAGTSSPLLDGFDSRHWNLA